MNQQAEKTLPSNTCSSRGFHTYSVIGQAEDAWSQLSSLKVFHSDGGRSAVDLVDVIDPCRQPSKSHIVTFNDTESLDNYLASNPIIGRTRFM